jgi:hypothetical protein
VSLRPVYSVLVGTGPVNTEVGRPLLAETLVSDVGTALALSIPFIET